MAGKPSAAQEAARKQWEAAPTNAKPSVTQLARKHKLSEVGIYKSAWWKARHQTKEETK